MAEPEHRRRSPLWHRALGVAAAALLVGGASATAVAVASQKHAPQPVRSAAGTTGPVRRSNPPAANRSAAAPVIVGPTLPRSQPVSVAIPAIGVVSNLQDLGLGATGAIAVPQPGPSYNEAAWYDLSPTPGQVGPSIIEGHIDSAATGPSVFFKLGALAPGDTVDVTLADGTVGVFSVTGVRQYPKTAFPTNVVYGNTDFAALHLITCSGTFDYTTGHYLSNTVVFASLTSSHPASPATQSTVPGTGGA